MTHTPHNSPAPAPQPAPQPGYVPPGAPPTPATAESSWPRRTLPLVVVTAIIAGGISALGTFLVTGSETTQSDAAIACTNVEQHELPLDRDHITGTTPLFYQLIGLSSFATAAALEDSAFSELEEPANNLLRGVQSSNIDLMNESAAQISAACESIDY